NEKKVILFRVQHEEQTVGALMLLVDQNRMLDYLSGFADFSEKPSIGLITHYLCMEEGLKRGFDAYDFLVGEKQHKDNLSTHKNQLCWLSYSRPSMKNSTMKTLRKVKHFMGTTSLFS
ncbi:GNAT family N-acetyltransferase, partial [bacterium]|nr:GNAT family N-acetyltransferase [bacterium]